MTFETDQVWIDIHNQVINWMFCTCLGPFDPQFYLNNAVSNIISALVFGHRYEYHDENFLNILRLDTEAVFLAGLPKTQVSRQKFSSYSKSIIIHSLTSVL